MIHFVDIRGKDKNTAHVKAPADMCYIMQNRGYNPIRFDLPSIHKNKLKAWSTHAANWIRAFESVRSGDVFIYQYPLALTRLGTLFMSAFMHFKKVTIVLLIHDLDSIRGYNVSINKKRERLLKKADFLICHNESMKKWIVNNGISPERVVPLTMFDYISDAEIKDPHFEKTVIIAGNLSKRKSPYIDKLLKASKQYTINLYGPNFEASDVYNNYRYFGSFSPEELQTHLEGAFGLVWDGDSLDECSGMTGNYLRYNNPHKTSLYISSGIPVIIWKEAALADYIEKENLGITVSGLNEIESELSKMTLEQYKIVVNNVNEEMKKLRSGFYLNKALDYIEVKWLEESDR